MPVWPAFVDALESVILDAGLGRIILGWSAIAGALVGLGLAFSDAVLFTATGLWLVAVLVLTVVAQYIDRRRLRASEAELRRVADRYARELVGRQTAESFTIEEWAEEVTVAKHGDADFVKYFTLHVGREPLEMFWHRHYREDAPADKSYQKRVIIEARSFSDEEGGRSVGTRYPVSTSWDGDSVRVFVHLDEPQASGSTFRVRLRLRWPRFYERLLEEETDGVEWVFLRETRNLSLSMTFARRLRLKREFIVDPIGNAGRPHQVFEDRVLRLGYTCEAPPTNRAIGFRLERPSR